MGTWRSKTRQILVVLVALTISGGGLTAAHAAEPLKGDVDERPQSVVEQLFQERAKLLVEGQNSRSGGDNRSAGTSIDEAFDQQIREYRRQLEAEGEVYVSSRTKLEIADQVLTDDGALHLSVTETTYLTLADAGTESGYSADHELVLIQGDDSQWMISEDIQLEPTGLLPLSIAEKYVDESSGYWSQEEIDDVAVDAPEAAIDRPEAQAQARDTKALGRAGYNYSAMSIYLEKYWSKYNSAYRNFASKGGDCTNFVSQALRAGGWKDKPGLYTNSAYWWYNSANQARAWTAVEYWASFARSSGRTTALKNVWDLRVGDVLQIKPKGGNTKIHTMMVSYFKNGVPYFTYHTSDRYRRSMNQVLQDWKGATFYAYRT